MEKKRYTLAIMVENRAGVLSQIAGLFTRKGYNIESIAAGSIDNPGVSRLTIEILAEEDQQIVLLCNQIRKLISVHSVKVLNSSQSIRRELMLIKVRAETPEQRNEVIQIVNIFRGSVIDVAPASLTVAIIGEEDKTGAMMNLFQKNTVLEMARTGMLALERGSFTLDENTKVRSEFNYSKNVR